MPTISLALGERSYDIHVENGALDRVGEFAYRAGLDGKIAIITDTCVAPLYAERVMKSLESAGFMPSLHVVDANNHDVSDHLVPGVNAEGIHWSRYT